MNTKKRNTIQFEAQFKLHQTSLHENRCVDYYHLSLMLTDSSITSSSLS